MRIDFSVFFAGALLLLILPLDWLAAIVTAAIFHELCHIAVLYVFRGKIIRIKLKTDACVLESDRISDWKQFLSILAGPAGSISLLLLCHTVPKVALCGLVQGLYNLIPVLPLDGGRLLRLLLYRFFPERTEGVMYHTAAICCCSILLLGIYFSFLTSAGPLPFCVALLWSIKIMPRKFPCKQSEIRVQ